MDLSNLKGKGAIVTGAAGGIGLGIARTLARQGVDIALVDIDAAGLDAARRDIAALGVRAFAKAVDVSDNESVRAAALEFEAQIGKVHFLFNNAGVEIGGRTLADVSDAEWEWIFGVNVFGVINGIRHFVPLLQKHGEGGHVVNTASIAGFQVNREYRLGPYSATKAAVVALSEALAQDLEGGNIGVSVLCPAAVNTRISESERNRPARYGGPPASAPPNDLRDKLRAALTTGMTPDEVGERVLRGIRNGDFYIFTHDEPKHWLELRFARILAAFDRVRG
ncbi:MAG: SDR family NAD(P)-dependent oxidoreductase [Betaproteobacteria bacterium]|nr:SDR family NAD(P)-dependent oxidoreductase [Betaproteobacteria bacterium]